MKAALIATGNEIVSGQVLNSNTSWLANELSTEGLDIHFHMAVLDKKEDLIKALNWLKTEGVDHIFMCGGLGPTKDDLTRQIVADFCNKEFDFYEPRWIELKAWLKEKNITPREGHKWQCYFPKESRHLINNVGTAWGFQTQTQDEELKIWTLPGPPVEFEDVYINSIKPWIRKNAKPKTQLVTWQCFNTPESEVAHMTEEVLDTCDYDIGYRASPPITEVKLCVPVNELKNNKWCKALDELFKDILYSKNGYDYLKQLLGLFKGQQFVVKDSLTQGELLKTFKTKYKDSFKNLTYLMTSESESKSKPELELDLDFKLGFSLNLLTEEVVLNVKAEAGEKSFSENIDKDLVLKSNRYRKYIFAKLIKRAASYFHDLT